MAAIPERRAIATAGEDANGDAVADGIVIGDIDSRVPIASILIEGWTIFDGRWDGENLLVAAREWSTPAARAETSAIFRVDIDSGMYERVGPDIPYWSWLNVVLDSSVYITRPTPDVVEIERASDGATRTFGASANGWVLHRDGLVTFPVDDGPSVAVVNVATWTRTDIVIEGFLPQFAALSPDGASVACSRQFGEVALHHRATGTPLWDSTLRLARSSVPIWSPDGTQLLCGNENNVTVIDAERGRVVAVLDLHHGGTWSYDYLGDTGLLTTAGISDGATLIVDPRDGTEIDVLPASFPIEPIFIATASSGELVGVDRSDFAVVDAESGRTVAWRHGSYDGATDFGNTFPALESSGRYVSLFDDASRLWRLPDGVPVWEASPGWTIRGADADAEHVIVSREDPTTGTTTTKLLTLREGDDGSVVDDEIELVDAGAWIGPATFSRSGELVVVSPLSPDWAQSLYRSDGSVVHRFDPHHFTSIRWGFTSDERLIFGGSLSGEIVGLDVATLLDGAAGEDAEVFRIAAHKGHTSAYQMSPDDRFIASQARAEPTRVWDVESGRMRAEFGTGEVGMSITFHPTKPWVYVSEGDRATLHTLDTDELIHAARQSLTCDLTHDEHMRYLRRSYKA